MKIFNKLTKKRNDNEDIYNICNGVVKDVKESSDPAFSEEMMGKGVCIITDDKDIYSPVTGELIVVFPTKHAYGIKTDNGVELLIHIGINTVELNGEGFTCTLKQGSKIKKGDKLCEVDFKLIKDKGYDPTIMVVLTNLKDFTDVSKYFGELELTDKIMQVKR